MFLKSHSFQQQQPFEDQQPYLYLHFDKMPNSVNTVKRPQIYFLQAVKYHLVTLKMNHRNI